MKSCVQWISVTVEEIAPQVELKPGTARSVGQPTELPGFLLCFGKVKLNCFLYVLNYSTCGTMVSS